jgi:hypothetical protein
VPLVPVAWFRFKLAKPNRASWAGSLGALSRHGLAPIAFALPAGTDPALAGSVVNHAFAVLDLAAASAVFASKAAPLVLGP